MEVDEEFGKPPLLPHPTPSLGLLVSLGNSCREMLYKK
jgi:hypothetical protein